MGALTGTERNGQDWVIRAIWIGDASKDTGTIRDSLGSADCRAEFSPVTTVEAESMQWPEGVGILTLKLPVTMLLRAVKDLHDCRAGRC